MSGWFPCVILTQLKESSLNSALQGIFIYLFYISLDVYFIYSTMWGIVFDENSRSFLIALRVWNIFFNNLKRFGFLCDSF